MQTTESQQRLARVLLWLTPALWAVNYIVARKAPGIIEPHQLALGRWGVAGLIIGVLARHELWHHREHLRSVWPQYLVLGTLGMLICGAWVYLGARTTGAMNIALIYSAAPVLIALGAVVWLGEHFTRLQVLGVAVAMSGVLHVIVKGQWLALGAVQWVPGDAWIVIATVAWAAYALLLKQWHSPLGPSARLAATCAGGVAVLIPFALWEWTRPLAAPWNPAGIGLVLLAALIPGVGAYWCYGFCQRALGAGRVAASLYLGPLYAALAAWGVLGESLGLHHAVGAALILPGIWLVSRGAPRPAPMRLPDAGVEEAGVDEAATDQR